jgi:hypothetical protein
VRRRKDASCDVAVGNAEARKVDACGKRAPSSLIPNELAITDGRVLAGYVEVTDRHYVVRDPDGALVGRFRDLKTAVRALPGRAA